MTQKDDRAASIIKKRVTIFLNQIREPGALITVTDIETFDKEKNVDVLITVFPEDKETEILKRLRGERGALRKYVKDREKLFNIPVFDFKIDQGEKNRQHIETLSGNI